MTLEEVKSIINKNIEFSYSLGFYIPKADSHFNKRIDKHGLLYLCEKIYNSGYEQGILDTLQGKVDKESIKMDTIQKMD